MAQQNIETTDNLPTVRTKVNENFTEVYTEIASINPDLTVGNGLTTTGGLQVALGTPSTLTTATTNSTTATSHTHAVTFPVSGAGNGVTLTSGTIALGTPGTLSGTTTNSVSASSHTHALDASVRSTATFASGSQACASGASVIIPEGIWYLRSDGSTAVLEVNEAGTWRQVTIMANSSTSFIPVCISDGINIRVRVTGQTASSIQRRGWAV